MAQLLLGVFPLGLAIFLMGSGGNAHRIEGEAPQPLRELPAGWEHLPQACLDCWVGAYHDSSSGAYLEYSVGPPQLLAPGIEGPTLTGLDKIDGIRYTVSTQADARKTSQLALEKMTGSGVADLIPEVRRTLPPEGCSLLSIQFHLDNATWSFNAAVCDPGQEARVRELLLGRQRLNLVPAGNTRWWSRVLSPRDVERAEVGSSVAGILSRLGRPETPYRVLKDQFALAYHVRRDGNHELVEATFTFNRSQRLVGKEIATN